MNNIPDFLVELLKQQYEEDVVERILNGYVNNRATTFRVNTLKSNISYIKEELSKNDIEYENVSWDENAFIIKNASKRDIEELDIYTNGYIYLQSLSSMLPSIILNPKPNEDILDMCAAPGGKTTRNCCYI